MRLKQGEQIAKHRTLSIPGLKEIPINLLNACLIITFCFWSIAYARHFLLQSNAYDLGVFDQALWLISKGITPISSIVRVHILADHGAWMLYIGSILYKLYANINWLFLSQAIGLSFTAIPLWILSINSGLNTKLAWLICGLWWMQPVVFNTNLFDFHPEVWGMPALASSYLMLRQNKPLYWLILCMILLGCRDGMVVIIAGIGIDQLIRRKYIWSISAFTLSLTWFLIFIYGIYPFLGEYSSGGESPTFKALDSLSDYLINPLNTIWNTDFIGGFIYLILISVAFIPFWNKNSITTLSACLPLVLLNFFGMNPSYRTLIHHYNLPIALIGVISVIDAISYDKPRTFPWKKFAWVSLCWFALAKPYFFTGPYLDRVSDLKSIYKSISLINPSEKVMTTSYIVPHLTHRQTIIFPQESINHDYTRNINNLNVILLNPIDPGWDSSGDLQLKILNEAKRQNWSCEKENSGLELCKRK